LQAFQIQPVMTSDLLIAQSRVRAGKRRSLLELAAGHPCVIVLQRSDISNRRMGMRECSLVRRSWQRFHQKSASL
jgi:hypothetical protein